MFTHEICIEPSEDSFKIKSFHQISQNPDVNAITNIVKRNKMTSSITINVEEFDVYQFNPKLIDIAQRTQSSNDEVIFCLKELKALLTFCDSANLNQFAFWFGIPGDPIKLSCKHTYFEVNLIMSTLESKVSYATEEDDQQQQQEEDNENMLENEQYDNDFLKPRDCQSEQEHEENQISNIPHTADSNTSLFTNESIQYNQSSVLSMSKRRRIINSQSSLNDE